MRTLTIGELEAVSGGLAGYDSTDWMNANGDEAREHWSYYDYVELKSSYASYLNGVYETFYNNSGNHAVATAAMNNFVASGAGISGQYGFVDSTGAIVVIGAFSGASSIQDILNGDITNPDSNIMYSDLSYIASDNNPLNTPLVSVEVANEANRAAVEEAARSMQSKVNAIDAKVDTLADSAIVTLPNGSSMSGLEFKQYWANLDFKITDKDFGPGRAGAVSGGVSTINFAQWNGWNIHPGGGEFIILHEVAHTFVTSIGIEQSMWTSFINRFAADFGKLAGELDDAERLRAHNDYVRSPEFAENEEWVNVIARNLAAMLGLSALIVEPTEGYEVGDLSR